MTTASSTFTLIVLDIFVISFCQFKLDNDVIKVLYNYIQNFYNENEKRKA